MMPLGAFCHLIDKESGDLKRMIRGFAEMVRDQDDHRLSVQ